MGSGPWGGMPSPEDFDNFSMKINSKKLFNFYEENHIRYIESIHTRFGNFTVLNY